MNKNKVVDVKKNLYLHFYLIVDYDIKLDLLTVESTSLEDLQERVRTLLEKV